MTGADHAPDAGRPEEEPLDLAAILRSEKLLSGVSERSEPEAPETPEEPLRLLAALAADVDDDDLPYAGDLGALPGCEETAPDGAGTPPAAFRSARSRRWVAAAIGLAAAVVGTTGVATAGTHMFEPIGGLFGRPSPSSTAAAPERSESDDQAPAVPTTGSAPQAPGPGRTHDPRATDFERAEETPAGPLGPPATGRKTPSSSPQTTSRQPSPTPSGSEDDGGSAGTTPSGDPTAHPSPSRHRDWPPEGLVRLGRDLDGRTRSPGDGS